MVSIAYLVLAWKPCCAYSLMSNNVHVLCNVLVVSNGVVWLLNGDFSSGL